jgi:phosphoglycerol transferase MdoB-like AlkP superfamily enzyme
MMEILNLIFYFIPMVLTALYFCLSSNAHKMVRKICKAEGIFITILIVLLCIGCFQLFWLIRLNPSLAKELSH